MCSHPFGEYRPRLSTTGVAFPRLHSAQIVCAIPVDASRPRPRCVLIEVLKPNFKGLDENFISFFVVAK